MSKKFSELDKDTKSDIGDELEAKSASMGMDAWDSHGTNDQNLLKDLIGMCYNCKSLNYCKTEFGNVHAICPEFKFKLNGQNRITECNLHSPKNCLSLTEMYAMAYLIEPNEEKVDGFITTNEKYMKKKKEGKGFIS
jgi:hypothetical protein